jgi:cbb3-type cytochrome oxidase subunit 3
MYKHIIKNQEGIQTIASIPLVLFFGIFVIAIVWFFIRNKNENDRMSKLPLE